MMKVMGFTLNNMSLMALSLAVGILIDDAIVVIENIFRHIEMGQTPFTAAKEATEELTLAILATSLSLMAVFVPIGNMGETIGQFFKQFGLTVAFAVAFSTIVAFSLTPMVSAYWIKAETEEQSSKERTHFVQRALDKFEAGFQSVREMYDSLMAWALERPKKVVAVGIISLLLNLLLLPFVGTEFQPTYDSGEFSVNVKAPIGTSLQKTVELAKSLQQEISQLPEVKIVALNIGNGRNPVNQGSLDIRLKPSNERERSMQQIMDDLRGRFQNVEGLKVTVVSNQGGGRGDSRPVQIGLRGSNIKELKNYAQQLADMMRQTEGATDVDISDSEEQPEIVVKLDHAKASEFGLDATEVGKVVEMAIMGKSTSNSYTIGDNDYDGGAEGRYGQRRHDASGRLSLCAEERLESRCRLRQTQHFGASPPPLRVQQRLSGAVRGGRHEGRWRESRHESGGGRRDREPSLVRGYAVPSRIQEHRIEPLAAVRGLCEGRAGVCGEEVITL